MFKFVTKNVTELSLASLVQKRVNTLSLYSKGLSRNASNVALYSDLYRPRGRVGIIPHPYCLACCATLAQDESN